MPDLNDILEKADRVVDSSPGVIDQAELEAFASVLMRLRVRAMYPEEVTVVALAGGTGSGKSSLFNAILSDTVAEVGGLRPTTGRPLASIPRAHAAGLRRYLEELDIDEIVEHDDPSAICLIDLPDTDSVELAHREITEAVLPRVDVVVWVVDPEKYRDTALHDRYLRPLAGHGGHFLFALNQVDRLTEPSGVVADFEAALRHDGIPDPSVIAVAAAPRAGPPYGVDEVVAAVTEIGDRAGGESGLVDLGERASKLAAIVSTGAGIEEDLGAAAAETLRGVMGSDRAAPGILTEALGRVAGALGGPQAEAVRSLQAGVPDVVQMAAAVVEKRPPRWATRRRREMHLLEKEARVGEIVEAGSIAPVHRMLEQRAMLNALLADLAVTVRSGLQGGPR